MTFDNEPGSPPKSLLYWSGGTYPLLPLILFLKNLSAENQIVEGSVSATTSIMLIQPSCQITSPVVAPNKNLAASRALSSKNG